MRRISILLFIAAALPFARTAAQDASASASDLDAALQAHVRIVARATTEGVILRWAVDKPALWQIARTSGFIVERADAPGAGMPAHTAFRALTPQPVMSWTEAQWEAHFQNAAPLAEGAPDYPMIAAALLDGKPEGASVQPENLEALREQKAQFEMQYGFALYAADRNADAAEGLGLRWVDRTVKQGLRVVYRVRLAGSSPVYRVDTGYVVVTVTPQRAQARRLVRASENDGSILLTWPASGHSAYRVERSTDGGKNFTALTQAPVLTVRPAGAPDSVESYADTLVENYRPYVYRVHGATPFADEELLGEVAAMGRDRTPPGMPFVPNPKQLTARAVRIEWKMDEPVAGDLALFAVLRDTSESGVFHPITARKLPPSTREFVDTTFDDFDANYYVVAAYDTAGNESRSMVSYVALVDSTAPAAPRILRGTMDSTGVVTLVLAANHERDVMGYRILRANAADHEFSSVIEWFGANGQSAARDTVILDTVSVNTLTRSAYYRATALDFHFNESSMSEIVAVQRPDRVPPVAPVIADVEVTDSTVTIVRAPGGSTDVARHLLYRRAQGASAWEAPAAYTGDALTMTDRSVSATALMEYALEAVDTAGNHSELSTTVLARPYDTGVLPVVRGLIAQHDAATKSTHLSWQPAARSTGIRYIVYRAANGAGLKKHAVTEQPVFIDAAVSPGSFEYAVKAVSDSGAESKMSDVVRVDVK